MSISVCLDDLSHKEDLVENKILSLHGVIKTFFLGIVVFILLKYGSIKLRKAFNSTDYYNYIAGLSEEEMKQLLNKLKELSQKTRRIQESLSRIIQFYYQPLFKSSLKTIIDLNNLIDEKIEDFELVLNTKFINSAKKILLGIKNSDFDVSKIEKVETFL